MQRVGKKSSRAFLLGVLQGALLHAVNPFIQATTMLPIFLFDLSGSYALSGLILTLQRFARIFPQIWVARFMRSLAYKKPLLVAVAALRAFCWLVIAAAGFLWGRSHPEAVTLVFLLGLSFFYLAGGLGLIAFNEFARKVIERKSLGAYFGWRGFLGGGASLLTALLSVWVLSLTDVFPHPLEHSVLFFLASLLLALQVFCVLPVKEPPTVVESSERAEGRYLDELRSILGRFAWFRRLVWTKVLLAGALLASPYYVIAAREILGQPLVAVGTYTLLLMAAKASGSLIWGYLGDRVGHKMTLLLVGTLALVPMVFGLAALHRHPALMYGTFLSLGLSLDARDMVVRNYLLERSQPAQVPVLTGLLNTLTLPAVGYPVLGALVLRVAGYEALFVLAIVTVVAGLVAARGLPAHVEGFETSAKRWKTSCWSKHKAQAKDEA
jgi:MFS family permease